MRFIDKAWRKQTVFELKLVYFLVWKVKLRFLFGLIAVSFLCYAVLVACYFIFVEKEDLFTTGRIPVVLNPVHMFFIAMCIVVILFLDGRGKLNM